MEPIQEYRLLTKTALMDDKNEIYSHLVWSEIEEHTEEEARDWLSMFSHAVGTPDNTISQSVELYLWDDENSDDKRYTFVDMVQVK